MPTPSELPPTRSPAPLLAADEAPPLRVLNAQGRAPLLLVCEHAGNAIPRSLRQLGLDAAELERHIAWDIGAAAVAEGLSERLDATLFLQPYSRLVIDCNRPRHVASLVPARSDGTAIVGNAAVGHEEIERRWREIHQPFHDAIRSDIERRPRRALLTVHSFTPSLRSDPRPRPMHLGLLYGSDTRFADALLAALDDEGGRLVIERNRPYGVDAVSDYAIPIHGLARGVPNLLLEIRQDQIASPAGQRQWIERLATALSRQPVQCLLRDGL